MFTYLDAMPWWVACEGRPTRLEVCIVEFRGWTDWDEVAGFLWGCVWMDGSSVSLCLFQYHGGYPTEWMMIFENRERDAIDVQLLQL